MRILPEEKVKCIESLLAMGKPYRAVARECSVSVTTVTKYARSLKGRVSPPGVSDVEGVVEEDVEAMLRIMRERLDPKHPAMTKLITDTSWWFHVILDFGKFAIPEVMSLMRAEEIDVRNPEATARAMVSKLKHIKQIAEERATQIHEFESRVKELEAELSSLRSENERLRRLVEEYRKLYDEALSETRKLIEGLRGRIAKTLVLVVKVVPEALSPSERAKYLHVIAPKIRELWGVEVG